MPRPMIHIPTISQSEVESVMRQSPESRQARMILDAVQEQPSTAMMLMQTSISKIGHQSIERTQGDNVSPSVEVETRTITYGSSAKKKLNV